MSANCTICIRISDGIHSVSIFTVNAPDADMTIRSFDGVVFKIHSINVFTHATTPVPLDGSPSVWDADQFDEESSVLELLFAYLYPEPPLPDLEDTPFALVKKVAYAAHKYGIASAMLICDVRMLYVHSCSLSLNYISHDSLARLSTLTDLTSFNTGSHILRVIIWRQQRGIQWISLCRMRWKDLMAVTL